MYNRNLIRVLGPNNYATFTFEAKVGLIYVYSQENAGKIGKKTPIFQITNLPWLEGDTRVPMVELLLKYLPKKRTYEEALTYSREWVASINRMADSPTSPTSVKLEERVVRSQTVESLSSPMLVLNTPKLEGKISTTGWSVYDKTDQINLPAVRGDGGAMQKRKAYAWFFANWEQVQRMGIGDLEEALSTAKISYDYWLRMD